jgi:hypothetical protein
MMNVLVKILFKSSLLARLAARRKSSLLKNKTENDCFFFLEICITYFASCTRDCVKFWRPFNKFPIA